MTPVQLAGSFGIVLALSVAIGVGFWWVGAPIVSAFAGLEVLFVAAGFGWHAVHAADGERIGFHDRQMVIELRRGLRQTRLTMDLHKVRVAAARAGGIELIEGRRTLRIGASVDGATNRRVMNELSQTLAAMRHTGSESE